MRRRGKGGSLAPHNQMLHVDGAHQLGKATHLGGGKLWLKTSAALQQYPVMKKASGINLKEKSRVRTHKAAHVDLNFILVVPVTLLVPNCSSPGCSFGSVSRMESGDRLHGQQPVLHITMPRLIFIHAITYTLMPTPGEDTPALPFIWCQLNMGSNRYWL